MNRRSTIVSLLVVLTVLVVTALLFTPLTDPDLTARPNPARTYAEAVGRIEAVKAAEAKQPLISDSLSISRLTGSESETSVVIFHGYTSVPKQFKLIAEGYASQGYNVWVPRLPYHGNSDKLTEDFSKLAPNMLRDFADDNIDIARGLGRNVIVIGFSGGGSLAVWSGSQRADVDRTILISPVLNPKGIPAWAGRPLARALRVAPIDVYKWWDEQLKSNNIEGYNYPRLSLRGLAAMLSLTFWSEDRAAAGSRPSGETLLIRNDGDQRLDSAYNEAFVRRTVDPDRLSIYRIPASAGLKHNFVSAEPFSEGYARIREAYRHLTAALGVPLPDPLATTGQ